MLTPGSSLVQSLSHVGPFVIPWAAASQASLSITISWSSLSGPLFPHRAGHQVPKGSGVFSPPPLEPSMLLYRLADASREGKTPGWEILVFGLNFQSFRTRANNQKKLAWEWLTALVREDTNSSGHQVLMVGEAAEGLQVFLQNGWGGRRHHPVVRSVTA